MVGTSHVDTIDLDYLITRTKSTILSNKTIREDFLYNNTTLKKRTRFVYKQLLRVPYCLQKLSARK
jgi:hypothetical protein